MLSFKGEVTSELLTSILQIMESKLDSIEQKKKTKKKVYNILVECLQNLYHHVDDIKEIENSTIEDKNSAIFMIGKQADGYTIVTGNFVPRKEVEGLKKRIDDINAMSKEELKNYYKRVLNDGGLSEKGGGGLGIIDIAKKSGQKLDYEFLPLDEVSSFFSLNVKIAE